MRMKIYTDDPSAYKKTLADIQSVSVEDVQRVYQTYIKNKPYVTTSFVPKGRHRHPLGSTALKNPILAPLTR